MTAASDSEFTGKIGEHQGGRCRWGAWQHGGGRDSRCQHQPCANLDLCWQRQQLMAGTFAELLQSPLILYRFYFALSCSPSCVMEWCGFGCDLPYGSALTGSYFTLLLDSSFSQ